MKNTIITALLLIITISVFAQSPLPSKKTICNNVISINPSAGIINNFYPTQYQQNEYLGLYHRIFGNANAIRIGLNGTSNKTNNVTNDTINSNSNSKTFKIGIGYERYQYLTKSWNYYFGIDAQFENANSASNTNQKPYYGNNRLSKINTFGALAFVGILVNINPRISITAENGFTIEQNLTYFEYENLQAGVIKIQINKSTTSTTNYINPQLHLRFKF